MSETKITPFMKEFAKFFETQGVIINFVDFEGKPIKQEETMTDKLLCPFCQQELRSVIQQEGENTHTTWHCPKCELEKYKWACGNKTLWQALIDTKKKLDIAMDELEDCEEWFGGSKVEKQFMLERIYKAYDQIEQIDKKEQQ